METTLKEFVDKYNIPKAWLAELCGFSRTQVSNWVSQPNKFPIPEAKKKIIQETINEVGRIFSKIKFQ